MQYHVPHRISQYTYKVMLVVSVNVNSTSVVYVHVYVNVSCRQGIPSLFVYIHNIHAASMRASSVQLTYGCSIDCVHLNSVVK